MGERIGGRQKGTPNKTTKMLRDAIIKAAAGATPIIGPDGEPDPLGERSTEDGLVAYLRHIAIVEPVAFCGLLGKVLPMQLVGDEDGGPVKITRIELVPAPPQSDAAKALLPQNDWRCDPLATPPVAGYTWSDDYQRWLSSAVENDDPRQLPLPVVATPDATERQNKRWLA